jgi:hypothetical protein
MGPNCGAISVNRCNTSKRVMVGMLMSLDHLATEFRCVGGLVCAIVGSGTQMFGCPRNRLNFS